MKKFKSLTNSYLSAFCVELSILVQSGISFDDGLVMMRDDEQDKRGKELLQSLIDSMKDGIPLSSALLIAECFPKYMTNMIKIGEITGCLPETLNALSDYYEQQDRLRVSIKNALMYPAMLLILMVAVVLVLIIRVLPIFNDIFNQLGTQMSPFAIQLMKFGRWLENASIVIAIVLGAVILFAIVVIAVPKIRAFFINQFKNIFGTIGIFDKIATSRFTSAMTLAIATGLDAEEAIEMASFVSGGDKAVEKKHKLCLETLRSGSSLSDAMRRAGILSAKESRMLALGGHSGKTDFVISEIARKADRSVQEDITAIVNKIEPTLVVVTSVIVGIILFSVMMPLMGIMTTIG